MTHAFVCDAVRSPIGRFGGALAAVRTDDLAAHPISALMARNPGVDWAALDDVIYGCANQAGEDNRNVARMASLHGRAAGERARRHRQPPLRLGAGGDLGQAARAIQGCGEAGSGHSPAGSSPCRARLSSWPRRKPPSRARPRSTTPRSAGASSIRSSSAPTASTPWRRLAENVAEEHQIARADQDRFALWSQGKAAAAQASGRLAKEIAPVAVPRRKGDPVVVDGRRAPAPRDHARRPRQAAGAVSKGRPGHRRQRLGRQRRRGGAVGRLGSRGPGTGARAPRPHRRGGGGRGRAPGHGPGVRRRRPRRCWRAPPSRSKTST